MSRDGVVFGIAGTCFGLILGWIIGSQQMAGRAVPATVAAPTAQSNVPTDQQAPPPIDLQRASALEAQAKAQPNDAAVRAQLGNLYFDSQRFDLAVPWYEAANKINPKDISVSTDLAVSYYYTQQIDKALAQVDRSLKIDPNHPTSLLNQGIFLAFGKQDFTGAVAVWDKVIAVAPNSPDAAKARQLKEAHASATTAPAGRRGGRGGF